MLLRSLFALTLLITVLVHSLAAINPAYLREQSVDTSNNDVDSERTSLMFKRSIREDSEEENNEEYILIKRNKYPNFHLSPLWLSRRTRSNRFYGKPLWISRQGR